MVLNRTFKNVSSDLFQINYVILQFLGDNLFSKNNIKDNLVCEYMPAETLTGVPI